MAVAVPLWRISKNTIKYAAEDMSGGGAAAAGGRWNSKGRQVVYTASSIALATLETLAHVGPDIAARNRFLIKIAVPFAVWSKRKILPAAKLPATWLSEPYGAASVDVGDAWLAAGDSALLLVPSVVIPEEFNVLLNPAHSDAKKITASVERQFIYDPRLR